MIKRVRIASGTKEQFEHAGICICTRSDQCGDFVDDKMICPEWERG